jgi:hypothetical protein
VPTRSDSVVSRIVLTAVTPLEIPEKPNVACRLVITARDLQKRGERIKLPFYSKKRVVGFSRSEVVGCGLVLFRWETGFRGWLEGVAEGGG